ncbi:MAG: type II toxin-antitoxin system Phd/YefM family antitoxin [Proteobacteria bacterium]|nr:type II toxin-antitoxin system Phd/YefM family antitoxin [Pseudomonadota bacterium]
MDVFSATDAKREFGEMLMRAQKAPVGVTRNGKPIAVIVSEIEYQALKLQALRAALIEGEQSGDAGRLDMQTIKAKAMRKAGLNG